MATTILPEGTLLGFGNPLLDITVHVDSEYLSRYGLVPNGAILAKTEHLPIFDEIVRSQTVEYAAGGATQNTARICQWLLQQPGVTKYIGCIGKDSFGNQLKQSATAAGVSVHYLEIDNIPSGSCACLITDKDRSLVAYLAAAEHYTIDHLKSPEIQNYIEKAKYFYNENFFLIHSAETIKYVAKHACELNKVYAMNLSAQYLLAPPFLTHVLFLIPYADFVFGNDTEAVALSKTKGWGEDIKEIAKKLQAEPKLNNKRQRVVVVTQGANPTIIATEGGCVREFTPIPCNNILDTNGAGDAFVGGFLAQLLLEKPLEVCIDAGHYCAWVVIQRSGCTVPAKPDYKSSV